MKIHSTIKKLPARCGPALALLSLLAAGSPGQAQQTATAAPSLPAHQTAAVPQPALGSEKAGSPRTSSPGVSALPASYQGRPLSIKDAVALALSLNPDLVSARESLLSAQGNTKAVRSGEGISASASGSLSRYNAAQTTNFGGQSITSQAQNSATVSGTISLPIDITGVLHAATSQAELQELASKLDVLSEQNAVVQTVKSAFYDVLRDKALVSVAQSDLQNAQANLKDAQLRYSAGTTTRYDVVSAQATVASSQQSLTGANNTLATAFATLDNVLGLDIDTPLEVTTEDAVDVPDTSAVALPSVPDAPAAALPEDTLKDVQPGQTLGDSGAALASASLGSDYTGLVAEAKKKRPEVVKQEASVAAAKRGIEVARKSGLPSVSLGYTESYTPTATTSSSKSSGETTLSLSLPLFDSGYVTGKVTQARASLASAETARRQAIDSVVLEVRKAYLNVQQSLTQVRSAREELAKADEGYRLARLRYSAGVTSSSYTSPLLELSDAQKTLSAAQKDYVNALYDYNDYRSALDKAVGRYASGQ
jgi:outer membrane protein TolC